jgi:LysM repeat protein
VAADFDGLEVACPSCNECLKLPGKPKDPASLSHSPQIQEPPAPQPIRRQDPLPSRIRTSALRDRSRRKNRLLALLLLLAAAASALLVLPGKKSAASEEFPALAGRSLPPEATTSPAPAAGIENPPQIAEESPEVLEPMEEPPHALPEEIKSATSVASSAIIPRRAVSEPPAANTPAKPAMTDPEDGLVEAIPDIPANRVVSPAQAPSAPAASIVPPVSPDPPATVAAPGAPAAAVRHHTVVRGDTLGKIARKYGVPQAEIKRANGIKNDVVRLGDKLAIPAPRR